VARNAVVTWKIEIRNDGTDPVSGIVVRDFLPAGSRYIQATGDHMFNCSELANYIQCQGGQLPGADLGPPVVPAGPATILVTMFAPDTPAPNYVNQAIVDPDNTIPEGNEFNNQSSDDIDVEDGGNGAFNDLQISKTVEPSPTVTPLGTIEYTIRVWNSGDGDAQNVTVRDALPEGVTFVSAVDDGGSGSAFTCSHAGGVVTCTGATITAHSGLNPRKIVIRVIAPNQTRTLTNEVQVDPINEIPEGSEQNNTATAIVFVSPVIDLEIKKTGPTTSSQSTSSP
jgi:uncharacterized repeat protein (TIGR01451 family)